MAPPRRSTRKVTKRKRVQDDSDSSSEDEDFKPVAKQPRRNARGKSGALAKLPSMPLDVVYEVLLCLGPKDLLNLARTSKDFRRLLMSRDSAHIWRTVIEDAGDMPECPDDWCPPAFVNLLYCSFCHSCGKGPCEKIYWDCRARYCNNCKSRTANHYKHYNHDNNFSILNNIKAPNVSYPLNYLPMYTLVPLVQEGVIRLDYVYREKDVRLHKPTIEAVERELSELKSEAEVEDYIKARARQLEASRKHIKQLVYWQENKGKFRADNNERLKKERLDGIKAKLISLGYEPYLPKILTHSFLKHPLVLQPKALTDRIWNNIEETIVDEMAEPVKQATLRQQMQERIETRLRILDQAIHKIKPRKRNDLSLRDIALYMPGIKELLTEPRDKEVTMADFKFLRATLPEYEDRWRADARQYLCDEAKEKLSTDVEDPFALAAGSNFICDLCHTTCTWPNILAHTCNQRPAQLETNQDQYTLVIERLTPRLTWKASHYSVHGDLAKAIVEAYGLSGSTATVEEMDECPVRMTCTKHNAEHTVDIMNWRAMLDHAVRNKCSSDELKIVGDAQVEAAKPLEEIARERNKEPYNQTWSSYGHSWSCAHCPVLKRSSIDRRGGSVDWHLRYQHKIETPEAKDYVYVAPISQTGLVSVRLLDENMKGHWKVDQYKSSDTAAYYPLT